jgi:hypothetical protein
VLLTELLNPDYALFARSETTGAYQPNSKSAINPDHLHYLFFAGMHVYTAKFSCITLSMIAQDKFVDLHFTIENPSSVSLLVRFISIF